MINRRRSRDISGCLAVGFAAAASWAREMGIKSHSDRKTDAANTDSVPNLTPQWSGSPQALARYVSVEPN